MIVTQERGIEFHAREIDGGWVPRGRIGSLIFQEMGEALGLGNGLGDDHQWPYLSLLTLEGPTARQRFIDYVPPED